MATHPLHTAFTHRCPRCNKGALYRRLIVVRPACPACGLSLADHDVGDGPAFFTITLLGFVVVGICLLIESAYRLPFWQNLLLSSAALVVLTPLSLRFFKSYLIAMKYRLHGANEASHG